ncbi:hypothetical protein K432DRAFT_399476 [Lepidopterella palustris CBS 459.81]|uniref:Uncharacterized protein n=1 Tax=Lepidopterella palustris CBS 459.81 TaxID=1314670 RepID=A0A8E2EM52_9PEZI|nr:hypothetical protein K432DRAFT_399476 [Lepidopterella palustris CBS 459.81]
MADDRNLFASIFKHSATPRSIPTPEVYADSDPRTTYMSKNNETGAAFACSAPAGSRHAKMMRELVADVQGIPPQQPVQPLVQYQQQQALPPRQGIATPVGVVRTVQSAATKVRNPHPPKMWHKTTNMTSDATMAAAAAAQRKMPVVVRRYEDERSVRFHGKSARGEVYVAAPKGSEEAEMHESIARGGQRQAAVVTEVGGEIKVVSRRPWWSL